MTTAKYLRNKGRSTKQPRHVRLHHHLMETEAWRTLDCVARAAYVELARRYAGPDSNNGRIPYSLQEMASALHISKATAMRAVERLQERGFVVCTKPGTFNLKLRHASEWRLTEFPCDVTKQVATHDYQRWENQKPGVVVKLTGFRDETVRVSR